VTKLPKLAGIGAVVLTIAHFSTVHADNRMELGGFIGEHVFNNDNELGVYDSADADSLDSSITFGMRLGVALGSMFGVEGELALMPTQSKQMNSDVLAIGWRAHGIAQFGQARVRPFLVLGLGGLTSSPTDDSFRSDTDLGIYTGIGAKIRVEDNWGIRLDARLFVQPSSVGDDLTTDFEVVAGLYKTFPAKPKKDEAKLVVVPPPPPPPPPPADTDGDGITDDLDECRTKAEDMDEFEDTDGCPDYDNDGDFVSDVEDKCPAEREDFDGFDDNDGCADPDNDQDKLADADDKCPNQAETANGYQDTDGCPDELPLKVQQFTGVIEGIRFRNNSDQIFNASKRLLDSAATVLTEFANVRMQITGYTDNKGDATKNKELSQKRADAVKAYLVSKGIAAERLQAEGKGDADPIGDNNTNEGRKQNRRVEFKLLP
jgi:OOP family OmpA-OmpF porin